MPKSRAQKNYSQKQEATYSFQKRTFDFRNPRQSEELLHRIEAKDLFIRQVAAVALARVSDQFPIRLLSGVDRLRAALQDDSAYVRWHIVYVLGRSASSSSRLCTSIAGDLILRLEDENRIVRTFACKALSQIAAHNALAVENSFAALRIKIPSSVSSVILARKPLE